MKLPDYVLRCIHRLENAGFAAYIVGGCVRDAQLGLTPADWDMCTAALPEQTEAVFSDHRLVLAGKKHGTVGVITEGGVVEITTFRTEGDYTDNRHPEWVKFVLNIEDDLARRDFTVNAMAFSPTRGFADPFGGREDLKKGILRAVGNPAARFREECGSIVCREILKNPPSDPNPTPRTAEFYKVRPCARMVLVAGRLLDEFIAEHPIERETP